MRTRFAGKTDVGLQREHNEDSLLVMNDMLVVAVADGMGGHRSGDVASQLAVSTLRDFFEITVRKDATWPFPANPDLSDEENYLVTGLRLSNRRIFDRSLKAMNDFGMGTTIVAAMFDARATKVTVAHVGDSRAYRIRNGVITQLTRDHSLVSDAAHMAPWLSEEEVAQLPPNVITRALGIREDVVVDLFSEATRPGDVYLLCSDGLCGTLSDEQMRDVVMRHDDLDRACAELVDRANYFGGPDNITVVLSSVEGDESEAAADTEKPVRQAGPSSVRGDEDTPLPEATTAEVPAVRGDASAIADTDPPIDDADTESVRKPR
jgi:serine/threonine protein phosphatase PrpC